MRCTFLFLFLAFVAIARADEPVKIGVLTDLSGPASYYGRSTQVGALLAQQELQASGNNIRIIFEDSALNTQRGLTAAQKLIFVDKVDALLVDFTAIAVAVSSLAQQQKVLMVYHSAAESVAKTNPFAFKTYGSYRVGCGLLAKQFLAEGITKIAVLSAEAEYGELCLAGAQSLTNVEAVSYKQGESVASQVLRFKNKGIQVIINASYEGDIENMLRAASDLKFTPRFGMNEDVFTPKLRERYPSLLEGTLTFAPQEPSEHFRQIVRNIPGAADLKSDEGAAEAYVHIKQLYQTVLRCHGQSRECLPTELAKSPSDSDIGFSGWENRMARLPMNLKTFRDSELKVLLDASSLQLE